MKRVAFCLRGAVSRASKIQMLTPGSLYSNEDYVDFETKLFLPYHKSGNTRLYWELNEIVDRTENAYKPVSHIIFEIRNPENNNVESNLSFAEEMAIKYGIASRKFHGNLEAQLVHFAFGN